MILPALIWLLQDFAQVFLMGFCVVPDVFLLFLVMMALSPSVRKEKQIVIIWTAFIGGLFWDFRWTNLPGLSAAINGASVAISCYVWQKIPVQGRTATFFSFIIFSVVFFSGLLHFIFWTIPNQVAMRQFLVQQLIGLPVVALVSLFFWKVNSKNA
jgi:cell shape-determining protein MreD